MFSLALQNGSKTTEEMENGWTQISLEDLWGDHHCFCRGLGFLGLFDGTCGKGSACHKNQGGAKILPLGQSGANEMHCHRFNKGQIKRQLRLLDGQDHNLCCGELYLSDVNEANLKRCAGTWAPQPECQKPNQGWNTLEPSWACIYCCFGCHSWKHAHGEVLAGNWILLCYQTVGPKDSTIFQICKPSNHIGLGQNCPPWMVSS